MDAEVLAQYERWFRLRHVHLDVAAFVGAGTGTGAESSGSGSAEDLAENMEPREALLAGRAVLHCDALLGNRLGAAQVLRIGCSSPLRVHRVDLCLAEGVDLVEEEEEGESARNAAPPQLEEEQQQQQQQQNGHQNNGHSATAAPGGREGRGPPAAAAATAGSGVGDGGVGVEREQQQRKNGIMLSDVRFQQLSFDDRVGDAVGDGVTSVVALDERRRACYEQQEDGELCIPLLSTAIGEDEAYAEAGLSRQDPKLQAHMQSWVDFLGRATTARLDGSRMPLQPVDFSVIVHFSVPLPSTGRQSTGLMLGGSSSVPGLRHFHTMGEFGAAKQWFPCIDTLTDMFTVTADVHVPAGHSAVFSGHLTGRRWLDAERTRVTHRFEQYVPVRAAHVALSVGPFEWLPGDRLHVSSPLSDEFELAQATLQRQRESRLKQEDEEKSGNGSFVGLTRKDKKRRRVQFKAEHDDDSPQHPVEKMRLTGFCLPGRTDDLDSLFSGLLGPIADFVQHLLQTPLPFGASRLRVDQEKRQLNSAVAPHAAPSEIALTFVDGAFDPLSPGGTVASQIGAGHVTLSTHLLAPAECSHDTGLAAAQALVDAMAQQYFGCLLTAKTWSDYWIIVGLRLWVVDRWMKQRLGNETHEYLRRLMYERVAETDDGNSPLHWKRPSLSGADYDVFKGDAYDFGAAHPWDAASRNPAFAQKSLAVIQMIELVAGPAAFLEFVISLLRPAHLNKFQLNSLPEATRAEGLSRRDSRLVIFVQSRVVSTKRFMKLLRKQTEHDLTREFSERWIYGYGCPSLSAGFWLNRKQKKVELAVQQEDLLEAFEDLEKRREEPDEFFDRMEPWPVPRRHPLVKPPLRFIIRSFERSNKEQKEARGTDYIPLDRVIELSHVSQLTTWDISKWPRLPRARTKTSSGREVASIMDAIESAQNTQDPKAEQQRKLEEEALEKKQKEQGATPVLWIRLDPDTSFPFSVRGFAMPECLWTNQLNEDISAVAQREACDALSRLPLSFGDLPSEIVTHTGPREVATIEVLHNLVLDKDYTLWQVRVDAAHAIAARFGNERDLMEFLGLLTQHDVVRHAGGVPANLHEAHHGASVLIHEYKRLFFDPESGPRLHSFADPIEYFFQCGLIDAISTCRVQPANTTAPETLAAFACHTYTPGEVTEFLLLLAIRSDNNKNVMDDAFFVCSLLRAFGRLLIPDFHSPRHYPELARAPLQSLVAEQIFRFLELESVAPSWRNNITTAALCALTSRAALPGGSASIMSYVGDCVRYGIARPVVARLAELGSIANFLSTYCVDQSVFPAVRLTAARCLARLALSGEPDVSENVDMDDCQAKCYDWFTKLLHVAREEPNSYVQHRLLLCLREFLPRTTPPNSAILETEPRAACVIPATSWDWWPSGGFVRPSSGRDPGTDAPFSVKHLVERNMVARVCENQIVFQAQLQEENETNAGICGELWEFVQTPDLDMRVQSSAVLLFAATYGSGVPACLGPRPVPLTLLDEARAGLLHSKQHAAAAEQLAATQANATHYATPHLAAFASGIARPAPKAKTSVAKPKRAAAPTRKRKSQFYDSDVESDFSVEEDSPMDDVSSFGASEGMGASGGLSVSLGMGGEMGAETVEASSSPASASASTPGSSGSAVKLKLSLSSGMLDELVAPYKHAKPLGFQVLRSVASVVSTDRDHSSQETGANIVRIAVRTAAGVRIRCKGPQLSAIALGRVDKPASAVDADGDAKMEG